MNKEKKLLLILGLLAFLVQGDNTVISPILPGIAGELDLAIPTAATAITAYMLPFGLFSLIYGPLADKFGKAYVINIASFGTAVFSSASGLAYSYFSLIGFRGINGIFAAGIIPLALSLIGDLFEKKEKQNAIGMFMGFMFLGQGVATAIGGTLAQFASWRWVFLIYGVLELIIAVIMFHKIKSRSTKKSPTSKGIIEYYSSLLNKRLIKPILASIFFVGYAVFGTFSYLGSYLDDSFQYPVLTIGLILTGFGIASVIGGRRSGNIKEKMGFKIIFLGAIIASLSIVLFSYATNTWLFFLSMAGFGLGFVFLQSTLVTTAQQIGAKNTGTVMALVAFCIITGGGVGTFINGIILTSFSYTFIFNIAASILLLLGLIVGTRLMGTEEQVQKLAKAQ
ncbi:MFS transporter [Natroniella sulfidigena]|uniref:MFS transporter n=1 Tax=Natroniella sulfidigena TaxID=723921 RepID=UPI00200A7465|nr:MFS transporter [Natroniella sulfidigena]MCK8817566.1 MFS transporter [Natroniella sulfidigena]